MTIEPVPTLTRSEAEHLTGRIRLVAGNVRDGLEKLHLLVTQAKDGGAHAALGYASWTAYLADVLGSEPMRLDRESRRELVDYLASEGMSTRAIAPIVGADQATVVRDRQVMQDASPEPESLDAYRRRILADAEATGKIIPITGPNSVLTPWPTPNTASSAIPQGEPVSRDADEAQDPVTVEAALTLRPGAAVEQAGTPAAPAATRPTVTGLDGKTYPRPTLAPPPARDYARENAEAHCREMANALDVLWSLTVPEAFERSFTDWTAGAIGARPSARERRNPITLRAIADALHDYADRLEGLR